MTKQEVIDTINRDFKGKCISEYYNCRYLNDEGKKCAIGLFIPDGHKGQWYTSHVKNLLKFYPDLQEYMPFDNIELNTKFQDLHDSLDHNLGVQKQKDILINFVEKNCK